MQTCKREKKNPSIINLSKKAQKTISFKTQSSSPSLKDKTDILPYPPIKNHFISSLPNLLLEKLHVVVDTVGVAVLLNFCAWSCMLTMPMMRTMVLMMVAMVMIPIPMTAKTTMFIPIPIMFIMFIMSIMSMVSMMPPTSK